MKLTQLLNSIERGDGGPPRAPKAMLWIPPNGRPIECPSVEAATNAATAYAGQKPGTTVAVYALVGYAFRPVEQPDFTPADSERAKAELRDCAPDTLHSDLPAEGPNFEQHRTDLSDAQQTTLQRLRETMRGDEDGTT